MLKQDYSMRYFCISEESTIWALLKWKKHRKALFYVKLEHYIKKMVGNTENIQLSVETVGTSYFKQVLEASWFLAEMFIFVIVKYDLLVFYCIKYELLLQYRWKRAARFQYRWKRAARVQYSWKRAAHIYVLDSCLTAQLHSIWSI